ncbi:hypothetical protein F53441_1787 [Fusarium austroafricanum]|uniref:Uncharacterized protein n=1 Tax=Fusarium austroafricanum TaxID=2364996 RepID=A0A8H4KSV2_9HYPO|nr:hypothetical protein F53441_1787 [Fusarium austroafricanum]
MKFTIFLTATLLSYVLAAPVSKNAIISRDETLEARRLSDHATPRIGVTVVPTKEPSDRKRSVNNHDYLVTLMRRVAKQTKAKCGDINTAVAATNRGSASRTKTPTANVAHITVRRMNNMRALLSQTVSILDDTPSQDITPENRQQLLSSLYTITKELHDTIKDYINTTDGATGARSMSRSVHMLTDLLSSIVTVDPDIASEMSLKLTPIFGEVTHDEGDLPGFVTSSVTEFLSSIETKDDSGCNGSEDCFNNLNEDLK